MVEPDFVWFYLLITETKPLTKLKLKIELQNLINKHLLFAMPYAIFDKPCRKYRHQKNVFSVLSPNHQIRHQSSPI